MYIACAHACACAKKCVNFMYLTSGITYLALNLSRSGMEFTEDLLSLSLPERFGRSLPFTARAHQGALGTIRCRVLSCTCQFLNFSDWSIIKGDILIFVKQSQNFYNFVSEIAPEI